MGQFTTPLAKQYSVIVAASHAICTQQERRGLQKRDVVIVQTKTHCNFCATNESPQWRTWKRFHLCNACGIKVWRKRDTDYYGPMPGKRSANRASLKKKDIDGGLDLLQFLKDSGEL